MAWILLESLIAGLVLVVIVWWTMKPPGKSPDDGSGTDS